MGSNKAAIDLIDFTKGKYLRNIYAERNPNVVKELGDVGNDILVYGSKLYVVLNASHKLEVLDAYTTKKIKQINIPNGRSLATHKGKVYLSSFVGEIKIDPKAPLGEVVRIDTVSLEIDARCPVGYQPEEMAIVGDFLYVANSGGYRAPNYDKRLSIIDLRDFSLVQHQDLGINLHHIRKDQYDQLWVSSRGDYKKISSRLFRLEIDKGTGLPRTVEMLPIPCLDMLVLGEKLLIVSSSWSELGEKMPTEYITISLKTSQILSKKALPAAQYMVETPSALAYNPYSKRIYVADAKNYVSSGMLFAFEESSGALAWSVQTSDIPAHICFIKK